MRAVWWKPDLHPMFITIRVIRIHKRCCDRCRDWIVHVESGWIRWKDNRRISRVLVSAAPLVHAAHSLLMRANKRALHSSRQVFRDTLPHASAAGKFIARRRHERDWTAAAGGKGSAHALPHHRGDGDAQAGRRSESRRWH